MAHARTDRRYLRLREALVAGRQAAKLTQWALARKLGRSQSFVSKYEKGERKLDVIEFLDIADELGLELDGVLAAIRGKMPRN